MTLKQLVFLRNDLKNYGKGALIAQACHATTSATFTYIKNEDTINYLKNINDMTKIILKIKNTDIDELVESLRKYNIDFIEWKEPPENIITCIATRPFVLDNYLDLKTYLTKYKLY